MTGFITRFTGKLRSATLLAFAAAAGLAGLTTTVTRADDVRVEAKVEYGDSHGRDYRHGDERRYSPRRYRHDHDHGRHHGPPRYRRDDRSEVKVDIDFNTGRTRIRKETEYGPRHRERRVRYWVEPVYQTVTERVWIEPVHETVYEDVYVPARYEVREIVKRRHGRKVVIRERVLIEPGHHERVPRRVCVSEGHWENVEKRVCVSEGRWNVVEKRVCVREGRWDYRVERVEVSGHEEETLLDLRF